MAVLNSTIDPATVAANQIRQSVKQLFAQMSMAGIQDYKLVWNNSKATPQQVIAALGTDATSIFQLADLNKNTLQTAASIGGAPTPPIPAIPNNYALTFNQDGSVTVATVTPPTSP